MHNQLRMALRLSALSMALLAAGCGGGGGDSASSAAASNMTVQGTAAKGIIKKGQVKVFAIGADGKPGASPVATGTTGDDGSYSVSIPKTVLNFIVEVSAVPGAKMLDEIRGEIDVPDGLKLRNVVALAQAPDGPYTGQVSPLTELAVKTAENATGGLSTANIARAKAAVRTVLGFDPETVKPINSNSSAAAGASEQEKSQSLILAAIAQMAVTGAAGCAQSDLVCVVNKVTAPATITSDKTTFSDVLSTDLVAARLTVAANTTINQTGKTLEQVQNDFSLTQKEVGSSSTPVTGVAAAKQLVASLRNTSQALQDATNSGGALNLSAAAMKKDFDQAVAPLDSELLDLMVIIRQGIEFFENYKAGTTTKTGMPVYSNGYMIGGCTVYSDADGKIVATSKDNAATVGCSTASRSVYNSYAPATGSYSYKMVNKGMTLTPTGVNAYSYKARAKEMTMTVTYSTGQTTQSAPVTIGNYGDTADARATGTITYTKSGSLISGFNVNGMMPARVDYNTGLAITDYELWNVNFGRTDEGSNVFKYALTGDLASKKAGTTIGHVALESGSFARVTEDGTGVIVNNGVQAVSLLISGDAGNSTVKGSLALSDGKVDKNKLNYQLTKGSFSGTLSTNSSQVFSGTLAYGIVGYENFDPTLPVSPTNQMAGTLQLNGTIALPNRPALSVLISATGSNTSGIADNVHGQYNDGTAVINATVTQSTAGQNIELLSANGVSVKIVPGQTTADVMQSGVKLGVINLDTGIINYSDGAFESLK